MLGQKENMVTWKPVFGLNKRYSNVLPRMEVLYRDCASYAMNTAHIYREIKNRNITENAAYSLDLTTFSDSFIIF
jgi:hypothetical protein